MGSETLCDRCIQPVDAAGTVLCSRCRDAARARIKELEEALRALVDKILVVQESPEYKAVWVLAVIHGQAYEGPQYTAEFNAARRALAGEEKTDG